MMTTRQRHTRLLPLLFSASLLMLAACASMGTPGGGPRDEDPPRFVGARPAPGSLNVSNKKIVIEFNELVNVKDAFTNVVVSPVSKRPPKVSSSGRRVIVEFQEDLLPNTTYTIDFGNSIEDNNEANKLYGFSYTFSTGESIDSLRLSGVVLDSRDMEAQQGIIVGVYSNPADTAFTRTLPDRIARTDDRGRFTVRGLAPGSYRIYALKDNDADYHYANPEESMAFLSELIVPSTQSVTLNDTIRNLHNGEIDSIMPRLATRFLPNDLLLRTFTSDSRKQYITANSRQDSTRLQLIFNAPQRKAPTLRLIDNDKLNLRYALEHSERYDTLTYWLRGHELISTDTLRLAVTYDITEVGKPDTPRTDTLRLVTQHPRKQTQKQSKAKKGFKTNKKDEEKKDETPGTPLLGVSFPTGSTQEINRPLLVEFQTPLVSIDKEAFHLSAKEENDSVWHPLATKLQPLPVDSGNLRRFSIDIDWDYGRDYRIDVDSLAVTGIYGLHNGPASQEFKTKKEEDYSALSFVITNFDTGVPAFVELLNSSDQPVARKKVENGGVRFEYLAPSKYYARIFEDINGNGEYDAGEFLLGRQPDVAYYYPKSIALKKNWDQQLSWDVFSVPVDMMKPKAIKKNKPDADKRKPGDNEQQTEEEEEIFDPTANPFDPNRKKITPSNYNTQTNRRR